MRNKSMEARTLTRLKFDVVLTRTYLVVMDDGRNKKIHHSFVFVAGDFLKEPEVFFPFATFMR